MRGLRQEERNSRDGGAVAVELALLLPILLVLVMGIVDFGRALNVQITLNAAAREGARLAAVDPTADVAARVRSVTDASAVSPVTPSVTVACPNATTLTAKVTVNYTYTMITPLHTFIPAVPNTINMSAVGVMRCES